MYVKFDEVSILRKYYLKYMLKLLPKKKINKYLVWSVICLAISFFITNYLIYLFLASKNSTEYYDALGYLFMAQRIKDHHYLIPLNYYLRSIVPYFTILNSGIKHHSTFCFINLILTFYSIYLFLTAMMKNIFVSVTKEIIFSFAATATLFPSILFVNSTMKPEWPTILIGAFILLLQNHANYFFKATSLVIGVFARQSTVFTAVYLLFRSQNYSLKNIALYFLFLSILSLLLVDSYWLIFNHFSFFDSTIYNPNIDASYNFYRKFLRIESIYEVWKLPFKILYSVLLESNLYLALDVLKNPESLNNLAGFVRVVSLVMFFYLGCYVKDDKALFRSVLCIYLSFLIPPIILTGFYQTRYLIVSDFVMYTYFLILILKTFQPNKIILKLPID